MKMLFIVIPQKVSNFSSVDDLQIAMQKSVQSGLLKKIRKWLESIYNWNLNSFQNAVLRAGGMGAQHFLII